MVEQLPLEHLPLQLQAAMMVEQLPLQLQAVVMVE